MDNTTLYIVIGVILLFALMNLNQMSSAGPSGGTQAAYLKGKKQFARTKLQRSRQTTNKTGAKSA
jgi:hypothetical protein